MLKKLFIYNLIFLILTMLFGIITSVLPSEQSTKISFVEPNSNSFLKNFAVIYTNNLTLLGTVLLGSITFGLYSILLLCWNGFYLGTGIFLISKLFGYNSLLFYVYIFVEFIALCLAVTAAEGFGITLFNYLLEIKKSEKFSDIAYLTLYSLIFITISGILESLCIVIIKS